MKNILNKLKQILFPSSAIQETLTHINEIEICIQCGKIYNLESMNLDDSGETYCKTCWSILKEEIKTDL